MTNEVTRKLCLIGDFGVGKTSLVNRYVREVFDDRYLTTVGVKIDTKIVPVDDELVKLVIWDIAGTEEANAVYRSYLRGMAGYLLVADGTRAYTLENALKLQQSIVEQMGDLPWVGLLNKADLQEEWEVSSDHEVMKSSDWLETSASANQNVEEAFERLAAAMAQA